MDARQITLVQESFEKVVPIADQAAELFYARLFELDPSLRALFKHDMTEQGRKLMSTLAMVVRGLKKPETIIPAVEELGKRHVDYGVTAEQYDTVGQALLDTLDKGLGNAFTDEVRAAWTAAYTMLAEIMIRAAYKEAS